MNSPATTTPSRRSTTSPTNWTRLSGKRSKRKAFICEVERFLRLTGYPHASAWSLSLLGRCDVWVLRRAGFPIAAVWFQTLTKLLACIHVHADPNVRGRWVTPTTLRYLASAARGLGVRYVCAYPRPEHVGFVRRLGFIEHMGVHILNLYESPAQHEHPQDEGVDLHSSAPG